VYCPSRLQPLTANIGQGSRLRSMSESRHTSPHAAVLMSSQREVGASLYWQYLRSYTSQISKCQSADTRSPENIPHGVTALQVVFENPKAFTKECPNEMGVLFKKHERVMGLYHSLATRYFAEGPSKHWEKAPPKL
jgi:hypothetical protein